MRGHFKWCFFFLASMTKWNVWWMSKYRVTSCVLFLPSLMFLFTFTMTACTHNSVYLSTAPHFHCCPVFHFMNIWTIIPRFMFLGHEMRSHQVLPSIHDSQCKDFKFNILNILKWLNSSMRIWETVLFWLMCPNSVI